MPVLGNACKTRCRGALAFGAFALSGGLGQRLQPHLSLRPRQVLSRKGHERTRHHQPSGRVIMNECPFCEIAPNRLLMQNELVLAFLDNYPVSTGHSLVIPKRHVASVFELSKEEFAALWQMVSEIRSRLVELHAPAGFNVGLNDGDAAGQTVPHAHVHVIPRYAGDVADPRGGVRWVIAEKAVYWKK